MLRSVTSHLVVALCVWFIARRRADGLHGTSRRLGTHIILEVAGVTFEQLNNSTHLPQAIQAAAASASLTVLDELYHAFPEQGLSGLLLLAESHLSYHTWPEHGYAAFDLFTCGEPTPLPCGPMTAVRYDGAAWRCADGSSIFDGKVPTGGLWAAVAVIVSALDAGGAEMMWMERGIPPRLQLGGAPLNSYSLAAHHGEREL